jgi:hypothetical protein
MKRKMYTFVNLLNSAIKHDLNSTVVFVYFIFVVVDELLFYQLFYDELLFYNIIQNLFNLNNRLATTVSEIKLDERVFNSLILKIAIFTIIS